MKQYPADRIRNVGLFAHGGAGKTSLAEALLFDTKATTRLGRVDEGNTVTDYDPDEIKRRISVSLAVAPIEWRDTKINVIDAPGYADFIGEVKSALRVCDAAIILIDASAGVEVGTEQAWRLAEERGVPRMIFINKMDRENADFARALSSVRGAFGNACAPIQFPIGAERQFKGVVDLLGEQAHTYADNGSGTFASGPIPDDLKDAEETYRRQLVEAIADQDEELMMRYLEDEEISTEELAAGLKQAVVSRRCGPGPRRGGDGEPRGRATARRRRRVPPGRGRRQGAGRAQWRRDRGDAGRKRLDGRPGVQDAGRPPRGARDLFPGLLRRNQIELARLERLTR